MRLKYYEGGISRREKIISNHVVPLWGGISKLSAIITIEDKNFAAYVTAAARLHQRHLAFLLKAIPGSIFTHIRKYLKCPVQKEGNSVAIVEELL